MHNTKFVRNRSNDFVPVLKLQITNWYITSFVYVLKILFTSKIYVLTTVQHGIL